MDFLLPLTVAGLFRKSVLLRKSQNKERGNYYVKRKRIQ